MAELATSNARIGYEQTGEGRDIVWVRRRRRRRRDVEYEHHGRRGRNSHIGVEHDRRRLSPQQGRHRLSTDHHKRRGAGARRHRRHRVRG